jgi:RimJ/RimL family protein N-acetyltransferase
MTSALLTGDVVVREVCHEPDGDMEHEVRKLILTPVNLKRFWDQARQFRTLFSEEIRGDFHKFLEVFLRDGPEGVECNGLFWVVDDFLGIMYMRNIIPGVDAVGEFSFFDRRTKGREPLVRAMLKYVFDKFQFNRISLEVGLFANPATMSFVESVGFKREGRKRRAIQFDGKWFDVLLYGMLREELKDES